MVVNPTPGHFAPGFEKPGLAQRLTAFRPRHALKRSAMLELGRLAVPGLVSDSSDEHSFIGFLRTGSLFVHIPKAAGNSVAQAIYGNLGGGHQPISVYQDVFRASALESFLTFTFVRNPWDRVYSAYTFLAAGGWPEWDAPFTSKYLANCSSFEQFVLEIFPDAKARHHIHFRPMAHFLKDASGEWYPFDVVGRFERFEKDFETVRRAVAPASVLKHRNKTKGSRTGAYTSAYTPEMIDMVAGVYAEDIAALGYTFDGFEDVYAGKPAGSATKGRVAGARP